MTGLAPDTFRNLLLSIGSHRSRRPLSPIQVAAAVDQAVRGGTPLAEVARRLHLEGPSILNRFLRLRQLPPDIRDMVDWGRTGSTLAFTTAAELARLPADEAAALARSAVEYQMSKGEVQSAVQLRVRSARPLAECVREVLGGRPQLTRLHLMVGAVTSPEVRGRLSAMPQGDRDDIMRVAFGRAFPAVRGVSTRLGADRFLLSGDDAAAAAIAARTQDFEAAVNSALEAEVLGVPAAAG